LGGIVIYQKEDLFLYYIPTICKFENINEKLLLRVNAINSEIQYGRLYIDEDEKKVRYKNNQGEFTWNRETKAVYYKGNNRKYPEFIGMIVL
jgi:hypothetical protein